MNRFGTKSKGFTIWQVMIPMIIVGVMSSIMLPSFSEMVKEQRLRQASSEFRSSIVLARSEAVKRNSYLSLVPNQTWDQGWCVNPNSDDTTCTDFSIFKYGITDNMSVSSTSSSVIFNDWGRTSSCPQFTMSIDNCSICLAVTSDGRVLSQKGQCTSSCVLDVP